MSKWSNVIKKPPVGVMPPHLYYVDRIKELSEAIGRYAEHDDCVSDAKYRNSLQMMAEELVCLLDIVEESIEEDRWQY